MGLAAAVIGGGVISAGASLFGASTQSSAAKSAASTQANASLQAAQLQAQYGNNALALQKDMFGTAQNALTPFMNAGSSVLPTLAALETPGSNQTAVLSQMPGFQFQSQYGTLAAQNALSAQGLGGSRGPRGGTR